MKDVGLLPEAEIHSRAGSGAPYDMGHDEKKYSADRVFAAADLASSLKPDVTTKLIANMSDADSAVRYWGAMGILMRGQKEFQAARAAVLKVAADPAPAARIVACEMLGRWGTGQELKQSLETLWPLCNPEFRSRCRR